MVNEQSASHTNPWAEIVGPCYTTASLARTLGWTEAAVTEAAGSLNLLKLTTSDEVELYPAFQIWGGQPVPGLVEVLRVLRAGVNDPWTWAQWLNTSLTDQDGVEQPSSIRRLREGRLADVLLAAKHDATVWHG